MAATLAAGLACLVFLGLGLALNPSAEYRRDVYAAARSMTGNGSP
ncbi:hypothetical protein GCM10027074_51910 [Streptomyces deserti]